MDSSNENELIGNIEEASGLFSWSDFQGYWRKIVRYLSKSLVQNKLVVKLS
jgi:hypothetical protein